MTLTSNKRSEKTTTASLFSQTILAMKDIFREVALAAVDVETRLACIRGMEGEEKKKFVHTMSGPNRAELLAFTPAEEEKAIVAEMSPVHHSLYHRLTIISLHLQSSVGLWIATANPNPNCALFHRMTSASPCPR